MQNVMAVTVKIFVSIGLEKNLEKTNSIFFTWGFIWVQIGKDTYKQRET